MKLYYYHLLVFVPVYSLWAQTEPADEEDVFELSPFVVTTDEDAGYYASHTLSGTRLNTYVGDVAASIQILTAEFLDDVGADNLNDLFLYTTNTEAAGLNGNFTDYNVGQTSIGDANYRVNPDAAQRVRGLGRATRTVNFFLNRTPTDRYNTERVEINRGANSILFGHGSPAGIFNTSYKQARYTNFGEFRYRFDSEGSNRFSLDINREVIEDRLALRINILSERTQYYQEPAFENDDRFYLTLHARPWKGATIQTFFETGDREANRPSLLFPASTMEFWFDSNARVREEVQEILNDMEFLDIDGNPLTVPGDMVIAYDVDLFDMYRRDIDHMSIYDVNQDGVIDASDDLARIHAVRNAVIYPQEPSLRFISHPNASRNILQVFQYDQAQAAGAVGGVSAIQTLNDSRKWQPGLATVLPSMDANGDGRFTYSYFASIQPWRDRDPILVPRNTDNLDIFDFTKNLISGEAAFQNDDWDQWNFSFEQVLFDNHFGLEVVFDKESYDRESFVPFQGYTGVFIDLMQSYLGEPNPNFGRPFIQSRTSKVEVDDSRKTLRITSFLKVVPEEIWGDSRLAHWFGEQTITGLYNSYKQNNSRKAYNQYYDIEYAGSTLLSSDVGANDSNRRLNYMVYLSDQNLAQLDSVGDVRLNRINNQKFWNPGQTVTITGLDPNTGEPFPLTLPTVVIMDGYSFDEKFLDSSAAIWNGYFFNDSLVGLVGWRRDVARSGSYDAQNDSITGLIDLNDVQLTSGGGTLTQETSSWSLVWHTPEKFLPPGTGLSLHYGFSENFTLGGISKRDFFNNTLPPPSGETREYGVTVKLFDEKLHARLNWFKSDLLNSQGDNLYEQFINDMLLRTYGHLAEAEVRGFIPETTDPDTGDVDPGTPNFDLGMQALGQLRQILSPTMIEEANLSDPDGYGNAVYNREGLDFGDTEDVSSSGIEVELTYNPKPNWRISLNIAQQETVTANYSPRLESLMKLTDPIVGSASGLIKDLPYYPNYDEEPPRYMTGPSVEINSIGQRGELSVYNQFRNAKAQEGRAAVEQREWRFNFITNYRFQDGFLKGFSMGTACRWQDGAVIGYPTDVVDGILVSDIENPHIAPSVLTVDVWLRYWRKIFNGKVDWSIELRVKNINTKADDLIPVIADITDEYNVAVWRSGPPRIWSISNTFKF